MSIYSGFSTRALESTYNSILYETVLFMQDWILEVIKRKKEIIEATWSQQFCTSFEKLKKLEKQKYLVPYFTDSMKELNNYIKANVKFSCDYSSDRQSVSYVSASSLHPDVIRISSKGNRYSNLQSAKSREGRYNSSDKKHISQRKASVKHYQDQILKSILKDLSNPIY